MNVLTIEGLTIAYAGKTVVRDVSITVAPGEVVALVGESGSGKSTVALAAIDLLSNAAEQQGRVSLNGVDICGLPSRERDRLRGARISMISQEPATALDPRMRIGTQVAESLRLHGTSRREASRRAADMLARVGMPATLVSPRRYPHQLSGGQRQRVAIAMAIAAGPALLIADEPTTALDVTTQAQVLALLRRLVREDDMGLLLISHDLAVVADLADRIVVMKDGVIVEQDTPAVILATPREHYTRTLIERSRHAPARDLADGKEELLVVRNLTRIHPGSERSSVETASFEVRRGETVGLVGESGSGKTTLLRAVLGLDPLQGGTVSLRGVDVSSVRGGAMRALRRQVQAVFQDPAASLDPRWTVRRIVAEPLALLDTSIDRHERRRRVGQMLDQVGLAAGDADRYPHQFSGGQRQRIAIARALVIEPALVVLDEAVSALDVSIRADILDLLAGLSRRLGVAYLFVSHDLSLMRRVADRLIVLRDGRIVEQGPTGQVMTAPTDPYTAALLAATPDIELALAGRSGQA
jgi:peptide/nickel transport system ATP-binding protein